MPLFTSITTSLTPKPTPPNFGIPVPVAIDPHALWPKKGLLRFDPTGAQAVIDRMPLLCQGDPALDRGLDHYLAGIADDQLPPKPGGAASPGNPVRMTRLEVRQALKGYGCYDTSIVTVIATALANRAHDLKQLHNRTAEFDQVQPISAAGMPPVSKQLMQVVWQYQHCFEVLIGLTKGGKKVQPMYFHEVVADFGNGAISESCDPYVYGSCTSATLANSDAAAFRTFAPKPADLTNERIIQLMKSGVVPMIAYNRLQPVLNYNTVTHKIIVTFADVGSLHKVVFSGFQSGPFPLLINDVGNGQRYRVRISSNLAELTFALTGLPGDISYDPAFASRPFLIYEGEEKKTNPLVFFIDHYDGLHIRV